MNKCFIAMITCGALLLTGCGKAEKVQKTGKIYTVGISIPAADHGWTGGVVWWAEKAKKDMEAKDKNVRVLISTARDAAEQVDKVENLLVRNIDALVILPHEPAPLSNICAQVKKQGKYLVVVDRGLAKKVQDVTVSGDNKGFGKAAAEALAKELGGKGSIVIMEGIPCPVNTDRVTAFKEVLKKYPGIKILESQSAYWDTEKGLKLMENFLQKYPKIDAVWTGDDDVLLGALKAYQESKRTDVKLMIGGAGSKTIIKKVLDGDKLVRFTVTYPPKMIAVGLDCALAGAKNKLQTKDKTVLVPSEIITKENAKKYYFPDSAY